MEIRGMFEIGMVVVWLFVFASADITQPREAYGVDKRRLRTKFFHGMGKRISMPNLYQNPYQAVDSGPTFDYPADDEYHRLYNDLKQYIAKHANSPYSGMGQVMPSPIVSESVPSPNWLNRRIAEERRQSEQRNMY